MKRILGTAALIAWLLPGMALADDENREVAPAPGRDVVKPAKPDYCGNHPPETDCDDHCLARTLRSKNADIGSGIKMDLALVAKVACDYPDRPLAQQQVAWWLQDWINHVGTTAKEELEAMKFRADPARLEALAHETCEKLRAPQPSNSFEAYRQTGQYRALGCGNDGFLQHTLQVDVAGLERPDRPVSELSRAAYVYAHADRPSEWVVISLDARRLDRKALDAEIAARGFNAWGRTEAIELFGAAQLAAEGMEAKAKRLGPEYAKLQQLAQTGYDDWLKNYQNQKAQFDLAYAMEDKALVAANAGDRQPKKLGCDELRKTWRDHVAVARPKNRQDAIAAAADPLGSVLLNHLEMCDALEGRLTDALGESEIRKQGRFIPGPRAAALWAVIDGAGSNADAPGQKYVADDHSLDWLLTLESEGTDPGYVTLKEPTGDEGTARTHVMDVGKIATVKKLPEGYVLTFKKESWPEVSWSCTTSSKIWSFQRDGTPNYSKSCKAVGMHTMSFQLEPRLVTEASLPATLKPGQIVKGIAASEKINKMERLFVVEIDQPGAGKQAPRPLSVLGVPLSK